MDAILRMPGGCFEQTSSSTYPNVLALDYMKRTKKLTPEVHAKAEGYIANGYQRLLTFEVPGGGFSWFGNPPANKILTAYGLMEFSDMAKVYDVDPQADPAHAAVAGPRSSRRTAGGSPTPVSSTRAPPTVSTATCCGSRAYIGWALENTGYQGPAVEKARQYVRAGRWAAKRWTTTRRRLSTTSRPSQGRSAISRHAPCNCCSTRAPRRMPRRGGTPTKAAVFATRTQRQRGDYRTRHAGAAQVGRSFGDGGQGAGYLAAKKDAERHLGRRPGHHHGAARDPALHREGDGRCARHSGSFGEWEDGGDADADAR